MDIKRLAECNKLYKLKTDKESKHIRDDKIKLKALLMKDVKTDDKGRVVLTKEDEWRKEIEWDELYLKNKKNVYIKSSKDKVVHAINRCNKKYAKAMKRLEK